MRPFKKAFLLGATALLLCGLVACNSSETGETETETQTETETETETETVTETESETVMETETETETETVDYSIYEMERDYAFLYNENTPSPTPYMVTATNSYGATFSVAEDCYLTNFSAYTHSWNDNIGEMQLCFWRWDTDYDTTTAADPVFTYSVKDTRDNSWVTVTFPKTTVGSGEWLYEFRSGSENPIGVSIVSGAVRAPADDPVKVLQGYKAGETTRNVFPQAYVTYEKYDTTKTLEAPDAAQYTKLTEGKAHVILLAGQSNATGISLGSLLENHVTEEQMARYRAGYANVLIDYNADSNSSFGFVPVKLGQGQDANKFGPELGLADYLSRTYPDETFYIIKSTASGSSLYGDWADNGGSYFFFKMHVRTALDRLEAQGLDPEIFAMMWMQGETDSWYKDHTLFYADREEELLDRINYEFGDYMAEGGMAFLDAGIYEGPDWTWAPLINHYKREFASFSQNRYYLDTNALGLDPCDEYTNVETPDVIDVAHYDSDDMLRLGELFGEALAEVLTNAGYAVG